MSTPQDEHRGAPVLPVDPPVSAGGRAGWIYRTLLDLRRLGTHRWFVVLIAAMTGAVTAVDLVEGTGREPATLYNLPILLAAVAGGIRWALVCSLASAGLFQMTLALQLEPFDAADLIQTFMFPAIGLVLGLLTTEYLRARRLQEDLAELNAGLARRVEAAVAAEREAQKKLLDSERLRMLGEAVAHIAHEIRNPLTALGGFTQRALRTIPEDHPARRDLSIVARESDRLQALLKDLLEFARPPVLQGSDRFPLGELVHEVIAFSQHRCEQASVQISIRGSFDDLPRICGDREAIKRALLNVTLNAIEAMPQGGALGIETSRCALDGCPAVSITVRDSGRGIPPDILQKVFEPFFTTKRGGTGIGLPVVKKTVSAHGGDVRIESAPGAGTTVTILLPIEIDPAQ